MSKETYLKRTSQPIMSMIYSWLYLVILSVSFISLLSACGSSGSDVGSPTVRQGKFIDSAVEGLSYVSGGQSGTTDAEGKFSFEDGKAVRFFLGGIFIGEATAETLMTPVELVEGAEDETHPTVTNISRFLQAIDDDGDLSNGIRIPQGIKDLAEGQTVNFEVAQSDFESEGFFSVSGIKVTSVISAQSHLRTTLLSTLVATYTGTYTGSSSGTWTFTIDSSGNLAGSATQTGFPDGPASLSGSISSNGVFDVAGTTSGGATFSGNTTRSGEISGTWQDIDDGTSGTFTGNRQ